MLNQPFAFRRTCPAENLCVLPFEASCGEEKFLEFLAPAEREISCFSKRVVAGQFCRDGDESIISLAAGRFFPILLQSDYPEWPAFDDNSRERAEIAEDHRVQRVAVGCDRARNKPPIVGVAEPIQKRPGKHERAKLRIVLYFRARIARRFHDNVKRPAG